MIEVVLTGTKGALNLNVKITVPMTGITALTGRSGAGKTTVLRAIAGFERLDGHVRVAHDIWQDETTFLPVHLRRVGLIFQESSLFSHLSVRENLDYAARRNASPPDLSMISEQCGITGLLARAPATLSGGEAQRVALARALMASPRLLLMDEPLASLDDDSKAELMPLIRALTVPVIYVSHARAEVEALANCVVRIESGLCQANSIPSHSPGSGQI